jgi:acetolactate synthase-1/2/3 large subunit
MRVADYIAKMLVDSGIDTVFSVTGGGAMHLNNAFSICPQLKVYYNHHEQSCAMAAEGYARISGKMAAVCVTSGPGGTNALTGVLGAYQDNIPMIVISGQVRYSTTKGYLGLPVRQYGEQEFDIINSIQNMTKYAVMVRDKDEIDYHLRKALALAQSGRRGPCWIDVPLDVQSAQIDENHFEHRYEESEDAGSPDAESLVRKVIDRLRSSSRPLVLAGTGIRASESTDAFRKLASTMGIPVVTAQASPDSMYLEHPMYYGPSGTSASRTGNFLVQNCDLLLVLGCRLGFKQTGFNNEAFAPRAYRIAVDIDQAELDKPSSKIDLKVRMELEHFLEMLERQLASTSLPDWDEWFDYCDSLKRKYPLLWSRLVKEDDLVDSYYFAEAYFDQASADQITVLGNSGSAIAPIFQHGTRTPKQRIIVNIDCGAMGHDLPFSIGAAIAADGEAPVTLITGDGSIHMNIQELQTVVHNKLPVKIAIFNNDGYRSIYQTHMNFFNGHLAGCTPESGLSLPDYGKIAAAYGLEYRKCHTNGEIIECIEWLLSRRSHAVLEVMQSLDQAVELRSKSKQLPDGTFVTPPIDDLYPFLDREEYAAAQYQKRG